MNPTYLNPTFYFISGAACMGALVCGLCFLRAWKKSSDRLFLIFAVAFGLLSLERLIMFFFADPSAENRFAFYSIRLLSFLMILIGIWDKNRARTSPPSAMPTNRVFR